MRKIIAVANQKGGVGKTTTAMSLGAALARSGKRVLLIDLDPQGNLSEYLGYLEDGKPCINDLLTSGVVDGQCIRRQQAEGLDYIPATLQLCTCESLLFNVMSRESVLKRILERAPFLSYDYILIDCQPSLGILTINAFAAANSVLIPVQSQKFAVDGLAALIGTLEQVKVTVNPDLVIEGIVQTMSERTGMSKAVGEALREDYKELLFQTTISRSVEAANSSCTQRSLVSYSNKLGKEYEQLARELLKKEAS